MSDYIVPVRITASSREAAEVLAIQLDNDIDDGADTYKVRVWSLTKEEGT